MSVIGPVGSLISPFSGVTIVASIAPERALYPETARPGQILTISLVAEHRSMGVRVPVDAAEAIAWARAIAGPDWECGLYDANPRTRSPHRGRPRRPIQLYAEFLTPAGATQRPPPDKLDQFRPLAHY